MSVRINEDNSLEYQDLHMRIRVGTKCKEYLTDIKNCIYYRTIKELLPHCHKTVKEADLNRRIRAIFAKEGIYKNIYQAMAASVLENNQKKNSPKQPPDTWYNDNIKLMKPGSLHKQARIMQAYPIGKRYG